MAQLVVTGATAMCTFGTTPGTLTVTSQMTVLAEGKPVATIQDNLVTPCGMCSSLANPAVAAATAAALGVLTPQPCTPSPAGPWIQAAPKVLAEGKPCLTNDCKLFCAYGGQLSIVSPGQVTTVV